MTTRRTTSNAGHPLLRPSLILLVSAVGGLWLLHLGPVPVLRGSTPLGIDAPFWYMLLAFPVLGMLVADLAQQALDRRWRTCAELVFQILALVGLSNLRLGFWLPISGHALLFSTVALRRTFLRDPQNPMARLELLVVAAGFALIAWVKLAWWGDLLTLGVGTAVGVVLFGIGWLAGGRRASSPMAGDDGRG